MLRCPTFLTCVRPNFSGAAIRLSMLKMPKSAARIVHQAPRRSHAHPLLKELHWLPVEQRICYKLAVLTFKIRHTSAPAYLSRHIRARSGTRSLRSSALPFLDVPFRRSVIGKWSFSCAAPATWNSLPPAVINCEAVSVFKSRQKLTCLILLISSLPVPPAPLKPRYTTALYKYIITIKIILLVVY